MWLIENDGEVFHHKRLWLRPGKRFIFGRTSAEGGGFVIANKTISRKHLIIELSEPTAETEGQQLKRSKITIEDLNTKIGTLLNGEQIRGQRQVLDGDKHEIKLGHYEDLFRITWFPVILTFSFTGKELKSNPMESLRGRLDSLDISVLLDYIRGTTTHVVAKKRNTSKGLQALINGKYIVDYTFIDAIVSAAQAIDGQDSALEVDFDTNWPDALQYLPPRGKEGSQRPSDAYSPDLRRQTIFEGFTFVFYEQSQFDNLLAPITNGRGKALLNQVNPDNTEVEDFVRYVKGVAGEKGLGEFEDGSEGKGVVVVRYQPAKGPTLAWYSDFGRQVSLRLDHRLIEQSEFLDAILENDPSLLRRPLEVEPSGIVASTDAVAEPPATAPETAPLEKTIEDTTTTTTDNQLPATAARRVGRSRRAVTRRFKGFDDEFDTPLGPPDGSIQSAVDANSRPGEPDLFVSQDPEGEGNQQVDTIVSHGGKAKRSTQEESNVEDLMEQVAPAATKFKRRRLNEDVVGGKTTMPASNGVEKDGRDSQMATKKQPKKEIDVLETVRQAREREEATVKAEREAEAVALEGLDVEKMRNLAIIEEMEVVRSNAPRLHSDNRSDRWDEKWNGRKNFKKFRRQGENRLRAPNKVIVPLQEVKKKDFGIGDEYWLDGDQSNRKKGGRKEHRNISTEGAESSAGSQLQDLISDEEMQETGTRLHKGRRAPESRPQTQTSKPGDSQPASGRKRKTTVDLTASTAPAAKKQRQISAAPKDDDSDDDLGFKFRKRS